MLNLRLSPGLRRQQRDWMATAFLSACLLLGGASQGGMIANAILQLAAAATIGLWVWKGERLGLAWAERVPVYLLLAALAWILIMLVPLPPTLWKALPGRDFVAAGYRLLDMQLPWLPIAMAPDRAVRSALSLLIVVAAWLLVRRLELRDQRTMIAFVAVIATLSAALGLAQMATGPQSGLRLYDPTNRDSPVGFFANANHFSVFLAASVPLAAAWVATANPAKRPKRNLLIGLALFAGLAAMALIVGRSLSGLGFLILALIGASHILYGRFASNTAKVVFVAAAAVAAIVVITSTAAIGTGAIGAKFDNAPTSRANMTPVTISAANEVAPTGSGLGSFTQIYAMNQPDQFTSSTWVNHAHNDYAELYLELGVPGIALVIGFLVWFLMRGLAIWRERSEPDMLIPQAAWLSAALLLLHSIVDYPLRTASMAGFFAAMIALIAASSPAAFRQGGNAS